MNPRTKVGIAGAVLAGALSLLGNSAISGPRSLIGNLLDNIYPQPNIYNTTLQTQIKDSNGRVCRTDSPLLEGLIEALPEDEKESLKATVPIIIFAPDVKNELGTSSGDVNGLYNPEKPAVIFVDTEADDGTKKDKATFPSVAVHEKEHKKEAGNHLPMLTSELNSFKHEQATLEYQLKKQPNQVLKATLDDVAGRVKTGEYLAQFGNDFEDVYPGKVVLAKDFLQANIPLNTLVNYINHKEKDPKKEQEDYALRCAAYCSAIVLEKSREAAINDLYSIVSDPKKKGTILQLSAASALEYLCPTALVTSSSSDVTGGQGMGIAYGKPQKKKGTGQSAGEQNGFSVSGIPSLQELLDNEVFNSVDPNSDPPSGTRYILSDVDVVKQKADETILIPKAEGKPQGFFCAGFSINEYDTNENGKPDGVGVMYVSPKFLDADGGMLCKTDVYDLNGKFIRPSINWSVITIVYKEAQITREDIINEARERNLERLK